MATKINKTEIKKALSKELGVSTACIKVGKLYDIGNAPFVEFSRCDKKMVQAVDLTKSGKIKKDSIFSQGIKK